MQMPSAWWRRARCLQSASGPPLLCAGTPHLQLWCRGVGWRERHVLHRRAHDHRRRGEQRFPKEYTPGFHLGPAGESAQLRQTLRQHRRLHAYWERLQRGRDRLAIPLGRGVVMDGGDILCVEHVDLPQSPIKGRREPLISAPGGESHAASYCSIPKYSGSPPLPCCATSRWPRATSRTSTNTACRASHASCHPSPLRCYPCPERYTQRSGLACLSTTRHGWVDHPSQRRPDEWGHPEQPELA
jgi:hypothetical protein